MTFTNNISSVQKGGAIYAGGTLTIGNNAVFSNNTGGGIGGAIYAGGTLTIGDNAAFSDNKSNAANTDTVTTNGGGAIYAVSTLNIGNDASFSNNTAAASGGAIYAASTLAVGDDATFSNNTAAVRGGAINVVSTLTVGAGAAFSGNTASGGAGGAINGCSTSDFSVFTNCVFTENSATGQGGAIYGNANAKIKTIGCEFSSNTSNKAGGAVYLSAGGDFQSSDTSFTKNKAGTHGGAIYTGATFDAGDNAIFSDNTASTGNGGAICAEKALTIGNNATFSGNTATASTDSSVGGGAIYAASTLDVGDSATFSNNTSGKGGGAIYVVSIFTIGSGAAFSDNMASGGSGGAINGCSTGDFSVFTNCVFTENSASNYGGAIYGIAKAKIKTVTCRFFCNTSGKAGGAIYVGSSGQLQSFDTVFTENEASTHGGAVYVYQGASYNADSCEYTKNTANKAGGAILLAAGGSSVSTGQFVNSIFCGNHCKGTITFSMSDTGSYTMSGGAICVGGTYVSGTGLKSSRLFISGCLIAGNKADNNGNGGGIAIYAGYSDAKSVSPLQMYSCTLVGNVGNYQLRNMAGTYAKTTLTDVYNNIIIGTGDDQATNLASSCITDINTYGNYVANDANVFRAYDKQSEWSNTDWESWDLTPSYNTTILGKGISDKINTNYTTYTAGTSAQRQYSLATKTGEASPEYRCGYSTVSLWTDEAADPAKNGPPEIGAIQVSMETGSFTVDADDTTSEAANSLNNIIMLINTKQLDKAYTIDFADEIASLSFTSEMAINYDITLSGTVNESGDNNVTLTANGDTRLFNVSSDTGALTAANINFTHTGTQFSSNGGAIYATKPLTLTHCSFSDFSSTLKGGALNTSGTLTISGCTFANNATSGDASSSYGGAIAVSGGTVKLTGTNTFSGNSAVRGGAIMLESGKFTISSGTTFSSNSATTSGGAIYSTATLTMSKAKFSTNHADGGSGGAIYSTAALTTTNATFSENYATGGSGGAIYAEGTSLSVTGGTFTKNHASKQGGAIMSKIGVTISGTTFGKINTTSYCNYAVNGGAIFLTGTANSTINNSCKFYNNYSTARGGAIYTQTTGTVTIDGTFNNNGFKSSTVKSTEGGAIAAIRGTVTISGSFSNNKAKNGGGAVFVQGEKDTNVTLNSSADYTSNAAGYGGAIRTGNYSKLNITGGTFASNTATTSTDSNGGAILNWSGDASSITNATFTGNSASNAGGAIANFAALSVTNCNIGTDSGNSAKYGGGIYTSGALTLSGTTISKNTASYNGGGVSVGSVTMSGTTTYGSITAGANDSVISENTATNRGGGLLIGGSSKSAHGTVGTPGAGYIRVYSNTGGNIVSNYISTEDLNKAHITTTAAAAALPNTPMMASVMSNLEAITVQEGASAVLPVSGTYLYDIDNDGVYDYQSESVLTSAELAALGYTPGTYEITVALSDADGNPDEEFTYKSTLTVEEAAAPNVACEANTFANGQILSLNIAVSGNAAAIAQWTINWGDGQTSVIDSLADSISATHAYTAQGTYDVLLQMVDTNGSGAGTWVYLTTHTFGTVQEAEAAALPTEISVTDAQVAENAAKSEIALYWDNAEKEDAFALDLPAAETAAVFDEADAVIFAEVPAAESAAPTLDLAFASASDADDDEDDAWQIF